MPIRLLAFAILVLYGFTSIWAQDSGSTAQTGYWAPFQPQDQSDSGEDDDDDDRQLWWEDEFGVIRSKLTGFALQADGKTHPSSLLTSPIFTPSASFSHRFMRNYNYF